MKEGGLKGSDGGFLREVSGYVVCVITIYMSRSKWHFCVERGLFMVLFCEKI